MSNHAIARAIRPDLVLPLARGLSARPRGAAGLVVYALVGVGAALGASLFHRAASQGEVAKFELALPALRSQPVEIDLAAQGWPKALLSPGTVSFRARVVAKQPLALRLSIEGAGDHAAVLVDGDVAGSERVVHVGPGRKTSIGVVFDVPSDRRDRPDPLEAALVVVADGTGRPLGRIPLRVIDSSRGATPISASTGGKSDHSAHTGH